MKVYEVIQRTTTEALTRPGFTGGACVEVKLSPVDPSNLQEDRQSFWIQFVDGSVPLADAFQVGARFELVATPSEPAP